MFLCQCVFVYQFVIWMTLIGRLKLPLLRKENEARYNRTKQQNSPYESTVCLSAHCWSTLRARYCIAGRRQSVCCLSHGLISKTSQDRPIVTMTLYTCSWHLWFWFTSLSRHPWGSFCVSKISVCNVLTFTIDLLSRFYQQGALGLNKRCNIWIWVALTYIHLAYLPTFVMWPPLSLTHTKLNTARWYVPRCPGRPRAWAPHHLTPALVLIGNQPGNIYMLLL